MKHANVTVTLAVLCAVHSWAADPLHPVETLEGTHLASITEQITSDLEHYTHVATVTKANEPYQPYIITVFDGKELEKRGISTLRDALELLPGTDMATDLLDNATPVFRGSNPFAYGQVKLLIDDMLVNNTQFDSFAGYLYMPIEIIKRIEVVRGPGSRTDGINAYAGSVHVITYAEAFDENDAVNRVFAKTGSYESGSGGFVMSVREGELRIHADSYFHQDDKRLYAGPDAASTGVFNYQTPFYTIDNTPLARSGNAPLQTATAALGLQLDYRAFSLKVRGTRFAHGSAYGINGMLPPKHDVAQLPSYLAELGWDETFGDYEAVVKLGAKYDSFESESRLAPPGFELPSPVDPIHETVYYPAGFFGSHASDQRLLYQSAFLKYKGFEGHNLTVGYRASREETLAVKTITTDRVSGTGLTDYSHTLPFVDPDGKRDTVALSLQDQAEFGTQVGLLYGINIEKTSLSDTQYDPRVSLVYQSDMNHIFKAIYSHSHRNPSWQELYTMNNSARVGNTHLKPETVDAFELAMIRKLGERSFLQVDLFYLINKDQIDKNNDAHEYRNAHNTDLYGLEIEWDTHFTSRDRFYVNYAYVDGKENGGKRPAAIAHHLAKASYLFDFTPSLCAGAIAKYVGSKSRVPGDMRDDTKAFVSADASLRYTLPVQRLSMTLSAKNIADAKGAYPSEPYTYVNDYPREGRTFLITLVKEF